ncbi:hypothetical protein HMPREF1371_01030 [Enterococcus faecium P1137]|nr:hypothetical protein HMPREF1371_01030 [Enterococcus faecium P1137]
MIVFNIAVFLMPSFLYLFVSGSQTISFFFLDFLIIIRFI